MPLKKDMQILLSNDDGIHAPGLLAMAEILQPLGQVTVVAPDRERSAASHSLTLAHPLRVHEVPFSTDVRKSYAVSGTPTDCVKIGLGKLIHVPPDVVVAGINRGPNLCIDVFYSGTVAAAYEGGFNGIPSFAVSLDEYRPGADYKRAARWAFKAIRAILDHGPEKGVVYNINVPGNSCPVIQGFRFTRLGHIRYSESYEERHDPGGRPYYWLSGEPVILDHSTDCDIVAVREGFVSITPIKAELTDYAEKTRLLESGLLATITPEQPD